MQRYMRLSRVNKVRSLMKRFNLTEDEAKKIETSYNRHKADIGFNLNEYARFTIEWNQVTANIRKLFLINK